MIQHLLALVLLITGISSTKMTIAIERYEKQCFYEKLCTFLSIKNRCKNIQLMLVQEVWVDLSYKSAISWKEMEIGNRFIIRKVMNTKLLKFINLLQFQLHTEFV